MVKKSKLEKSNLGGSVPKARKNKTAKLNTIGELKDFRSEFEQLQRNTKGVEAWARNAAYREFYRKIAKAADQRLVNLERLAKKKGYKDVTQWAYAVAMRDIRGMFGEDAKRFNRKLPNNMNSVYKSINRVLDFLEAPTSSKSTIDLIYDKRAKTLNERYGTKLNWSNIGSLFESTLWKKVNSKYGSKTALKAIGQIQMNKKQILDALNNHKPISLRIEDDINVEETVNKFLRYYKKDVSSLTKKLPKKRL